MVCSLCHPLSRRWLWRAINQQRRQRQACFASNRKIREVDCRSRSFITWAPPYLANFKVSHTQVLQSSPSVECLILSWLVWQGDCARSSFQLNRSDWFFRREQGRVYNLRLIARPPSGPPWWPDWDGTVPLTPSGFRYTSGPYPGFDFKVKALQWKSHSKKKTSKDSVSFWKVSLG